MRFRFIALTAVAFTLAIPAAGANAVDPPTSNTNAWRVAASMPTRSPGSAVLPNMALCAVGAGRAIAKRPVTNWLANTATSLAALCFARETCNTTGSSTPTLSPATPTNTRSEPLPPAPE